MCLKEKFYAALGVGGGVFFVKSERGPPKYIFARSDRNGVISLIYTGL